MKFLILGILVAGLAAYVVHQRHRNYPVSGITSAGRHYEAARIPDFCDRGACMQQVVYLTHTRDTVQLREEAKGLLPWVESAAATPAGAQGVYVIALEPGLLKMGLPRHMTGVSFGRLPGGSWKYLGQEDQTQHLQDIFQGR